VDVKTLREVGRRIRENGWPAPQAATAPTKTKDKDAPAGE
jgi:hypothetical protein